MVLFAILCVLCMAPLGSLGLLAPTDVPHKIASIYKDHFGRFSDGGCLVTVESLIKGLAHYDIWDETSARQWMKENAIDGRIHFRQSFKLLFTIYDYNHDHKISFADLQIISKHLGYGEADEVIKAMLRFYDLTNYGLVEPKEFMEKTSTLDFGDFCPLDSSVSLGVMENINIDYTAKIAAIYQNSFVRFSDASRECVVTVESLIKGLATYPVWDVETAKKWMTTNSIGGVIHFRESFDLLFQIFDYNHDTQISFDDLQHILKHFGYGVHEMDELIKSMIQFYDLSGNDIVELKEFVDKTGTLNFGGFCPPPKTEANGYVGAEWNEPNGYFGPEPKEYFEIPESNGYFGISESNVYYLAVLLCIVLCINILFMTYINCYSSKRKRKRKYKKVQTIASSDDDMQNLQEYKL